MIIKDGKKNFQEKFVHFFLYLLDGYMSEQAGFFLFLYFKNISVFFSNWQILFFTQVAFPSLPFSSSLGMIKGTKS